ncbi:MAG: protein translocase subunit SecD [Fimbriimonadaceae bacterium]|nr:protein translocase subunit SecD [Fimbriimonadaceae bacterium]QYK54904.1 MAG: protein translocase subunit SecD [Fimbriimonadaceae bacterium]
MQSRGALFLLVVLVLAVASGFVLATQKVSYGLDVKGGVRFTYQMDTSEISAEQKGRLGELQSKMKTILTNRASGAIGVSEPSVSAKGQDQFIIELPGFTNEDEARSILSNTAKVVCYWAKTVSTEDAPNRRYKEAGDKVINDVTYVTFGRRAGDEVFGPGDPAYVDMIKTWEVILEGEDVANAQAQVNGSRTQPYFTFSSSGARKLEAWSRKYMNRGEKIAFVLDNKVLSIAPVKDGTILSDNAFIDGDFPPRYVQQLTELIRAGSLPVPLIELESQKVDPTIGVQALNEMVTAGLISLAVICIFLIVYYAFPGAVAAAAMILYGVITLAVLILTKATFSLAAIAAFILSTGMAVDANILVFERLKEEIRNGRELMRAIEIAFKRALSSIIDSNIATIITCLVLFYFGTGQVKGFASTLAIGVALSFFTAFVVTRAMIQGLVSLGIGTNLKHYALNRNWFGEKIEREAETKPLKVVQNSKRFFLISAALILPGLIALAAGGIKPNVEFQGGFEASYFLPEGKSAEQIRQGLSTLGVKNVNVKFADSSKGRVVYLTIPPTEGLSASDPTAKERIAQAAGLSTEGSSFYAVGPQVSRETVSNAISGVLVASLLIMVYLAIRFGSSVGGFKNGVKFGLSAVIALLHDVLFVVGTAAIVGFALGWEISALFITAMLTVIGFSVHDTIIIFDRIRENLRKPHKGWTFEHLCNVSVSQTLARSINTSASALIPLLILLFIGTPTPELKFMVLTMFLGIAIGTYSSILNATPILYLWNEATIKAKGESAGLMAEATRENKLQAQIAAGVAPSTAAAPLQPAQAPREATPPAGGGAYGQIKRRSGVVDKSTQILDDDED